MTIKNWFTCLTLILFFQNAQAAEVVTTVFNVIPSSNTEKKILLVLSGSDGRIYRAPKNEETTKLLKSLLGAVVKINADDNNNILNIRRVYNGEVDTSTLDLNQFRYNELRQFAPTELQSKEEAAELFDSMLNDGDKRRSQCFKRAHMWAFDMWSKLGINSQKQFIFYTTRYIQLEDFDWWFHVAPLVVVNGQDYVLDGTFMNKPVTVLEWRNFFLKSPKISCPVITDYKEYEKSQWSKLCFLMKTPMYYFSPLDIQNRDLRGEPRNHWVLEELQDARRAFKNFEDTYDGLDTGKATKTF